MSVKPELAFDVCWECTRDARSAGDEAGISALNWKDTGSSCGGLTFVRAERVGWRILRWRGGGRLPRWADWLHAWCCSASTTWGPRRIKMRGTFSA